ncbi:MAG: nuclear transport factor 2 family protein [Acidobacteriota bacterium]
MKIQHALFALALTLIAGWSASADPGAAEEIQSLIEKSYVNGAFNELNAEALEGGFHPDFAIFSPDGEAISKFPIGEWVERTAKRKEDPEFDPAKNVWTHRFASVDVTGHAASVKIELSKDGKLVFTDYLSLLKFDSGWRVVAKVYFRHE